MNYQCVSDTCDQPMAPGWDFCPACGVDNRPPMAKKRVDSHAHQFVRGFNYCIRCGEPADEPYAFGYRWRVALTFLSWALGVIGVFSTALTQFGHAHPESKLGKWVSSWYSIQVSHRRGRRYSSHHYTSDLGADLSLYLGIGGAVLIVVGFMLLFKKNFSTGSNDEPAWFGSWRGRSWF